MIGKTIARIEEQPTDPKYGYARDDTLLIHFTDGTALRVTGHSYEEVSLSYDTLERAQVADTARAAQGRREKERIVRLQREEWKSLSVEERDRRTAERRAKMTPMARMMDDQLAATARSMMADLNRQAFAGNTFTIPVHKPKLRKARRS